MKTIIRSFILIAVLTIPFTSYAQSPLDKVFDKYAGQDRFTTVNISKEMFQMFSQMMDQKDTSMTEMRDMMEHLTGLKVLTYNIDTLNYAKAVTIYNDFAGLYSSSAYKELMSVNEGRDNYRFLTKQDGSGMISEMVMLMKGKSEVMVLSLTGKIDMANVSKLSKGMGIKGMEGLHKMKEAQKEVK